MNYSKLVFTGPESTGKSTTALLLAQKYSLPLVHEYAREYLNITDSQYEIEDLYNIAKVQRYRESLKSQINTVLLCDTDILTLYIWSIYKFGKASFRLREMYRENDWRAKHYLLFKPDIPWADDVLRENPNDRDKLYDIYVNELEHAAARYTTIGGSGASRVQDAEDILNMPNSWLATNTT